jgi:hypothetical protein
MAKFRKRIVKEGTYNQFNPETGQYDLKRVVSKDDIKRFSKSAKKMEEKGIRIPGPWKHDLSINSFTEGNNGLLEDATKNAGFWSNIELIVAEDGKLALEGDFDAPGNVDDFNTPAGKVGTIVKDTSVYIKKNHKVTDSDDVIEDAIMHIALVTHPIENNQENFTVIEDGSEVLAMSQLDKDTYKSTDDPNDFDDGGSSNISELVAALKDTCRLFLPEGTNPKNLVNNLLIAVKQFQLLNTPSDDDNDTIKVEPLIMNQSQIDALVKSNTVNPETGKPFTVDDFKVSKTETTVQSELIMAAMQTEMQNDRRRQYKSRIDGLVKSGRVTDAYAQANLYPKASIYAIAFTENKVAPAMIDDLLMSLEALPEPVKPTDEVIMSQVDDVSAEDAKTMGEIADYMATLV